MGIFVKLKIIPNEISFAAWEATYQEAIKLIQFYPFLDIVSDNVSYDCLWNYADNPSEVPIKYCDNNIGFRIFGDLVTMETAESFELIRDLHYYRNNCKSNQEFVDILQLYINNFQGIKVVFNDKTQGYDYHKYILAIACLFEHRLQPYAIVLGDISKGQMEDAVEWVNSILEQPIQISQRANNEILSDRIKKLKVDELLALKAFMEATINEKGYQLGSFIKTSFSKEIIIKYYTEEIAQHRIGTFGFSDIISEYLNLGNDLVDLCDICITSNNIDDISLFIKAILDLGIHLEFQNNERLQQKQLEEQHSFQSNKPYSKVPDTVNSLFGKFFSNMMQGNKRQSNIYIPLDKLVEIFKEKFSHSCDVDALINGYFAKISQKQESDSNSKSLTTYSSSNNHKNDITAKYDIETLNDLIYWELGYTIRPELEAFILKVKEFIEQNTFESAKHLLEDQNTNNKKSRMKHLITHNRYFLISKKSWDYIEEKIEDNAVFTKLLGILSIKAEEIKINRLCLSLLNNIKLFEQFILCKQ